MKAVTIVNFVYVLLGIVLLVVLAYAGVIRPTGLASRRRDQEEDDRNRSNVARWLKKHDPD